MQIIAANQLWDGPSFAVGEGGGLAQGFAKCLPANASAATAVGSGAPTLCTDVAVVLLNRLGTARKLSGCGGRARRVASALRAPGSER